jgi:hypothetical protein
MDLKLVRQIVDVPLEIINFLGIVFALTGSYLIQHFIFNIKGTRQRVMVTIYVQGVYEKGDL